MENLNALIEEAFKEMEFALENEILIIEQLDHAIEKLGEFKEKLDKQINGPEGT